MCPFGLGVLQIILEDLCLSTYLFHWQIIMVRNLPGFIKEYHLNAKLLTLLSYVILQWEYWSLVFTVSYASIA